MYTIQTIKARCAEIYRSYSNDCKEFGLFSAPGHAGIQRKAKFDELVSNIQDTDDPVETFKELYRFYKRNSTVHSRLITLLRRHLAALVGIDIPKYVPGPHNGNLELVTNRVKCFKNYVESEYFINESNDVELKVFKRKIG